MPLRMNRASLFVLATTLIVLIGIDFCSCSVGIRQQYANWTRAGSAPQVRRSGGLPHTFDFIVVGAGTAGCVLGRRLSEKEHVKVLVIEAGTTYDDVDLVSIPVNWDMTPFSPVDYSILNEGLEPVVNLDGNTKHVAAGKALGGSTAINTMMYVRGNHLDYDKWNVEGWSFDDVLPFFKKAETSPRYYSEPDGQYYHGNNGPIELGAGGWQPEEDLLLVQAANNSGLAFTSDWNGATQIGSGFHELTVKNGQRITSYAAYLKPVLKRKNLWVMDRSQVQRIIFQNTGSKHPRAKGVVFVDHLKKKSYTVKATKEIILSAGALHTPQLLMISGIGPKADLERIGVKVIKNLPGVGQNLQDHPITTMVFSAGVGKAVEGGTLNQDAFNLYESNKIGIVASIRGRTNFFFRSALAEDERPDAQIILTPPGFTSFVLCYLLHPRSRGHLRLFSNDITDHPLITANYYQDNDDLLAMMSIMNMTYQILQHPPVLAGAPFDSRIDMTSVDNLKNYIIGSSASSVVANTKSGYHFVGTCKMGDVHSDPMAVVDARLRVKGIRNLRIADASIMPELTSGNTQAPTYMIGEKASHMIYNDHNL